MTRAQAVKILKSLESHRTELLAEQKSLQADLQVREKPEFEDSSSHQAFALRRLELVSSELTEIGHAILRIEDGTYGTCAKCDRQIPLKRLEAKPHAQHCVRCQEAADQKTQIIVWGFPHRLKTTGTGPLAVPA